MHFRLFYGNAVDRIGLKVNGVIIVSVVFCFYSSSVMVSSLIPKSMLLG